MEKFDLGYCTLTIRESVGGREVLVENGHPDGPIWLAKGEGQIKRLVEILSDDGFVSNAKKMLAFVSEPKKLSQIQASGTYCQTTMLRMIACGAVETYDDTNNEVGRGHRDVVRWYVATGKPYKFRRPKTVAAMANAK